MLVDVRVEACDVDARADLTNLATNLLWCRHVHGYWLGLSTELVSALGEHVRRRVGMSAEPVVVRCRGRLACDGFTCLRDHVDVVEQLTRHTHEEIQSCFCYIVT